ncbi:helix-turn-helix domain-containing protein [Streptomyces bohaiensis]|uniref:Helix-turn-helix domain-containing protein n=1 Tax=Streptomyces bohaiensis TaxID=1431344 RepID=A0ABX1CI63_9ACTN|nr:helix-turn-helix transcriptional regulator [Streptomyces bohaiensis]NJQ16159.1 helix-turn-helix domain-containing protein [Streptomyces bohaiensis]
MASREPYAEELRAHRERAGLTQIELGDRLRVHATLVTHWEAGRRKPCPQDAERLDEIFDTGGTFRRFLKRRPFAEYFERVALAEQGAKRIEEFAPALVPGLLQTEAYARVVFRTSRFSWREEEFEEQITNRMARQRLLGKELPEAWFILSEAVLRIVVGNPALMAAQLAHIAALVRRHRVTVQVVPFSHGSHAAMASMVTVLKFQDQPDLAYEEGACTGRVADADTPDLVRKCRDAYDLAKAAALPPAASLSLLESIMEEYRRHDDSVRPEPRMLARIEPQQR